ncbi:NAD-dependent epimerase/dehydratase [Rhodospirillaceae bacterium LM-1]|nr:NAD-dependent epimerase/dehydratase [Rhodospirillaceae bacterium LM-1]
MLSGSKIVVTGGAGFIGSELVRQLAEAGAHVIIIDNLVNGNRANLDGLPTSVELAVADIRDVMTISPLLDGARIVYHLACLGVRHSIHAPQENHEVNAQGSLIMLEAARQAGVPRFVYVSSSEVYGTARNVPMSEDHPTFPHTVYGASKLAGECYARAYYDTYGYATTMVRPFNAFGPRCHHEGDSGEVIPKFMLSAMAGQPMVIFGDGQQTRDFTYVGDTAQGIMLAGLHDRTIGRTINLGSGKEVTIEEISRLTAAAVGKAAIIIHDRPRPGDVLRLCADSSHAQDLLGFNCSVEMAEGLRRLHRWYLDQGASPEALLADNKRYNWLQPKDGDDV